MTSTRRLVVAAILCGIPLAGCRSSNESRGPGDPAPPAESHLPPAVVSDAPVQSPVSAAEARPASPLVALRELFPGVHADVAAKVVEFDAIVSPMLMDDPKAPLFFVETLVCAPDTHEHESLLVTSVKPSHLHAAMLAIGLTPGSPGMYRYANGRFMPIDASGDPVSVEVFPRGDTALGGAPGQTPSAEPTAPAAATAERFDPDPRTWLISVAARDKTSSPPRRFGTEEADAAHGWVFAGSSMRKAADKSGAMQEVYDADGTGIVIGLCCFGSEVIAWSRTFSHDASIDAPEWIADFSRTPPAGTHVRVRVRAGR